MRFDFECMRRESLNVCVCVCVRACVRACVRVRVCVHVSGSEFECLCTRERESLCVCEWEYINVCMRVWVIQITVGTTAQIGKAGVQ